METKPNQATKKLCGGLVALRFGLDVPTPGTDRRLLKELPHALIRVILGNLSPKSTFLGDRWVWFDKKLCEHERIRKIATYMYVTD